MAAGNHLENGICALFVIAAIVIAIICSNLSLFTISICRIFQCPCDSVQAIDNKIATSPIRLVRAVISPALNDFGF
jgi:hypothetical protein